MEYEFILVQCTEKWITKVTSISISKSHYYSFLCPILFDFIAFLFFTNINLENDKRYAHHEHEKYQHE